jgi:tRNA A-37 threonylcarbamoyl transferase component Bud32
VSLGRYELLRRLARGGMADVYLARRRAAAGVEKRLVIKRIRRELAADPRFVQLFVREARLTVGLAHANIVPVFDFGRIGDELFLAMEYVDGRDLAAALRRARERGEPLDPVLIAHIGAEACQALDYAHRRRDTEGRPLGIVHRDVTPRNVLLSFAGEVKLVDFGVASLADEEHGRLRGTPAYMSPEQARGEPVDARSDLFALGLVLHEALGGEKARGGPDALAQARAGEVPALPEHVPAALRRAVERATRSSPGERFADAREMQGALEQIVVEARAADPTWPAPGHALGQWLQRVVEGESESASGEELRSPEGGEVVTFLEDGEEAVSRAAGEVTQRSVAETIGEDDADAPPAPAQAAVPQGTRRPQALWPWALTTAAAIVAGSLALRSLSDRHDKDPPTPATAGGAPAARKKFADAGTLPSMATPPPAAAATKRDVAVPDAAVDRPSARAPKRVTAAKSVEAPKQLHAVEINARPWARVFIDGRYVDDTPLRVELSEGIHRLRFENPVDGSGKSVTIEVPRDRVIVEDLGKP